VVANTTEIDGGTSTTYVYGGLDAGAYTFICSIHPVPTMTGTLTVN
jgi:plastocyanin